MVSKWNPFIDNCGKVVQNGFIIPQAKACYCDLFVLEMVMFYLVRSACNLVKKFGKLRVITLLH